MMLLPACLIPSSKWFFFEMKERRWGRQHFLFDVLIMDWAGEEQDYWLAECCQMWEIFEQRSKELRLPQCRWTACELLGEAPESIVRRETMAFNTRFLHTRTGRLAWNSLSYKITDSPRGELVHVKKREITLNTIETRDNHLRGSFYMICTWKIRTELKECSGSTIITCFFRKTGPKWTWESKDERDKNQHFDTRVSFALYLLSCF